MWRHPDVTAPGHDRDDRVEVELNPVSGTRRVTAMPPSATTAIVGTRTTEDRRAETDFAKHRIPSAEATPLAKKTGTNHGRTTD
jgi:hypothetical protein